jgi:hypothetical protein
LNFDFSTLSFHVPTSSLCASAMRGSIMDTMANKEKIANVVNGRFMMFLLKTRFYGDELLPIMVTERTDGRGDAVRLFPSFKSLPRYLRLTVT